jgi:hypothetical protein
VAGDLEGMRIVGVSPRSSTSTSRASGTVAGQASAFARELGEAAGGGPVGSTAPARPLAACGAVLTLQTLPDAMERRRRQVRRGTNLLDQLDELKLALLDGRIDPHLLAGLSRTLASALDGPNDPALDDLIQMIEVRAAVELAKLEMEELVA